MESLIAFLKKIAKKVEEIENRLNETQHSKLILEESKVAARKKELEGKTYSSNNEGGIVKEVRIPFCDVCGSRAENFSVCTACGRKLCGNCVILYENRILCFDCLNEALPLSKEEYKVLLAFASRLSDLRKIARIARIKEDSVKRCKKGLEDSGLILSRGFLLFKEVEVSAKGLEAISAYRQVYCKDEDVKIFEYEMRRALNEKG
jgi:DNA-binding MarR family transcriptional regulator